MAVNDFPTSNGEVLEADTINRLQNPIRRIYTGTDLNSAQTNAGSDESTYEFTEINAAELMDANYIKITITGHSELNPISGAVYANVNTQLKVQTKEIGGAYADSTGYQVVASHSYNDGGSSNVSSGNSWTWVHTVTSGQKTAGIQIKVFSTSYVANNGTGSTGVSSAFTNKQVVVELG